jgi:hypothetical protein
MNEKRHKIYLLSVEVSINTSHILKDISGSAYLVPFTQERYILSTSPFVHRLTCKLVLKILKLNFKIIFSDGCGVLQVSVIWPSSGASKIAVENCCTSINEQNSKVHPRLCAHELLCVCSAGWFLLRVVCSCLCSWLFLTFSRHIFGRTKSEYGPCSIPGLLVARAGGAWHHTAISHRHCIMGQTVFVLRMILNKNNDISVTPLKVVNSLFIFYLYECYVSKRRK